MGVVEAPVFLGPGVVPCNRLDTWDNRRAVCDCVVCEVVLVVSSDVVDEDEELVVLVVSADVLLPVTDIVVVLVAVIVVPVPVIVSSMVSFVKLEVVVVIPATVICVCVVAVVPVVLESSVVLLPDELEVV